MEMLRDCLKDLFLELDDMILKAQHQEESGNDSEFLAGYIRGLKDAYELIYSTNEKFNE